MLIGQTVHNYDLDYSKNFIRITFYAKTEIGGEGGR